MNYLIFTYGFVCLILTVNGATDDDEHFDLRERCMKEIGLEKDGLSSSTFLQNPKSKCFLKCFLEGLELYKEDNSMDAVRAVELISMDIREQARPVVNKCIEETESKNIADRCEKSFESIKCLHKDAPDILVQLGILEPPKKS